MKVLIVGGGGREHAIAEKLLENPRIDTLYAAPGNGGMAAMATCLPIKATDIQAITDFCVKEKMDFVVVAPDDPLVPGIGGRCCGRRASLPLARTRRPPSSRAARCLPRV